MGILHKGCGCVPKGLESHVVAWRLRTAGTAWAAYAHTWKKARDELKK
jgi:hypothetical protein